MKQLLEKLKAKVTRKRKGLIESLEELVGPTVLSEVVSQTNDRREVVRIAASLTSQTEESLTRRLASKLSLPYESEVCPMNLSKLPEHFKKEHYRYAASVINTESSTGEAVVYDPELFYHTIKEGKRFRLKLASWSNIEKAIEDSSHNAVVALDTQKPAPSEGTEELRLTKEDALDALREVFFLAREKEAREIFVRFEKELSYSFPVGEKTAKGNLHHGLQQPLRALLEDVLTSDLTFHGTSLKVQKIENGYKLFYLEEVKRPVSVASIAAKKKEAPQLSEEPLKEMKLLKEIDEILLVEDNLDFARILTHVLQKEGFEVSHVQNGQAALERLSQEGIPKLMITDLHMPEMNGFELITKVRGQQELEDLEIVALTSDEETETQIELISQGADSFVGKNEDLSLLIAHVKRALARAKRRKERAA